VDESKKKTPEGKSGGAESNRRRIGLIVHDDRGMASVEWRDAPDGAVERPVLEVLDGPELTLKDDGASFDPYSRHTATHPKTSPGSTRTDLRKLSEWIKMKRALEERKARGDDDDKDQG
jgi:hypothetical protein